MKTAEEKAKELCGYFHDILGMNIQPARLCAIKVCDEVIEAFTKVDYLKQLYWQAVKTAITKL